MSTIVDPSDLRFEFQPFEKPLEWHATVTGGDTIDMTKRGSMRAVWDSPKGPFYLAWASAEDLTETYENEPELRSHVAANIQAAYKAHEARTAHDPGRQ